MGQGIIKIKDDDTRSVVQQLANQINALQAQVATLQAAALQRGTAIDAGGQRITNVADPQAGGDAVSRTYLAQFVQAQIKGL